MKTEPIYMLKPYETECTASVLEVINDNNETRVILDKTVFYPMGGGQPTDQGEFILEDGTILEVYQVMVKDGEINHYVKGNSDLNEGQTLKAKIDWERRYKNMKVHSAGHIIDFALFLLGYSPARLIPQKADHGKKPFIIYLGILDVDIKDVLQKKVNEMISDDMQFSWEMNVADVLKNISIYLQPGLPENKPLRSLTLENVGTVADGGTIVKSTSEVRSIQITQVEIKEGNTIIHYSVGEKEEGEKEKKEILMPGSSSIDLAKYGVNREELLNTLDSELSSNSTAEELTVLWRKYLGKEGIISTYLKNIVNVEKDDRKIYGQALNEIKNEVDRLIENKKFEISQQNTGQYLEQELVQLDYKKPKIGHLHPLTQTTNDLNEIFRRMGYSVLDGPEIETDEYCFQRLNLPFDHPARDLQDSIFIEEPNILLRTQTSSIEARALEMFKPPFKVIMPGRVYRNEKVNKSNHFTFHQYQLTVVKEKVSMAELFATINHLFKSYYGEDVEIRFRCKYYPEVEPGVGPDMKCFNCHGEGKKDGEKCSVCKGRGWIEMGGAGIIHPNVLRMAGLDPEKYQGFAFGMGLDRWAMAKHKITDIRTLLGGNLAYMPNVS